MATGWTDNTYPTINMDLIAQTIGNMAIDIAAQTIGNLGADIKAQTLDQLIGRDKRGTWGMEYGTLTVTAAGTSTMLTVTGKGMIYSIVIRANHSSSAVLGEPYTVIDGVTNDIVSWDNMNDLGLDLSNNPFLELAQRDTTNHIYMADGWRNITFETGFVLKYYSPVANGDVKMLVIYSVL